MFARLRKPADIIRGTPELKKDEHHTFKPVLFEFPTYEYFVTGEKIGNCARMN